MSLRKAFVSLLAFSSLLFLVACGGSGSPTAVAPPSGGFSDSNLSGTYVFSSTGLDSSGAFLTMVGSLAANGSGAISGGTIDIEGVDIITIAQPITGGSYKITSDGRGQIGLNTTVTTATGSAAVTFTLDLVLTSSSHGLVTEYDSNGSGSGTIDLQGSVSQAQLAGSYAFGVSGAGITGQISSATVGAFTLDDTGAVTAGEEDVNNGGGYTSGSLMTASTVSIGTVPGTATVISSAGTSYNFDVYPIDNTHLKFIQVDGQLLVSGDAYTQGTSIPTGQLVFTMTGSDDSSGSATPFASGGYFTNTSGTITAGLEDFNDGGTINQATSVTGSVTPLTGGRGQITLAGFVNGAANAVPGSYTFAAYPFTANGVTGVQLLEIDALGVSSGAAYAQTSTALATAGYGLNLTGFNPNGEEDDIAEFTTTATGFTGIVDLNDEGITTFDKSLNGSFPAAVDTNGRGSATTNYFSYDFYTVNANTFLLVEVDTSQVGVGTFEQQTASTGSAAMQPAVSMLRPAFHPHTLRTKQK